MLVHELAELLDVATLEESPDVVPDRLRPVEVGLHLRVPALRPRNLIGQDRGCRACLAGVEEKEVVPEPLECLA